MLEFPRTPGHDGIRAPGHQSMTAASKAKVVIGGPGAGPTCFAVTPLRRAVSGEVVRPTNECHATFGIGTYGSLRVQIAQTRRASLLAIATATLLCTWSRESSFAHCRSRSG
jgi:hypothetical protein